MTTRETAMKWWNKLSSLDNKKSDFKHNLALTYYNRPWNTLTGREIEYIWQQEQINSLEVGMTDMESGLL